MLNKKVTQTSSFPYFVAGLQTVISVKHYMTLGLIFPALVAKHFTHYHLTYDLWPV
jgi:hypothetical protein